MRIILTQGECQRPAFLTATGAAGPLQIIGRMRRHVVHRHRRNAADVDAHFHRRRAAQHVQLLFLEQFFKMLQAAGGLLCGMLGRTKERAAFQNAVA